MTAAPPKTPVFSQAAEAERCVVASMMVEKAVALRVRMTLESTDFAGEANRIIYDAIGAILDENPSSACDIIMVIERLTKAGKLDAIGGTGYITKAVDFLPSVTHADHYARLVKEASLDRQIAYRLQQMFVENAEKGEVAQESLRELHDLLNTRAGTNAAKIFDFREDLSGIMDELLAPRKSVIMSDFKGLDRYICGFEPEELWTIGARTGGGKTAMMVRLMINMAQQEHECLYLTTEMKVPALLRRILPMATGIPAWKFRKREFTKEDISKVNDAAADILSALPIKMLAKPKLGIQDIRSAILRAKPKVVFLDYLQRCTLPKGDNRVYQIEDFMVELKTIAAELGVLLFLGAQLDRATDRNPGLPPVKADLRGSGAIEHESDGILLLWKPPLEVAKKRLGYQLPAPGNVDMEAIIAKGRECPDGVSSLMEFDGELVRILEKTLAYDRPEDPQVQFSEGN